MEPATPAPAEKVNSGLYTRGTIFLAVAITIDVLLAIALHWKTYDWLGKFLAVALMFNIVTGPPLIRLRKKQGNAGTDTLVQSAYISLLLATILFNR